ncbi:MAG: CopG family transcriptional regulator [Proteobacteria bacterium]|nr:CopG family transcriptional regulator [Pseudomonadota bacterium]
MRTVLSISLPGKISSELDAFAKSTGRNKSDIVKESICLYLWETKYKAVRKTLGAKAKKAGFVTDEDIFKAVS